jgi:prepilin-type processing-associated H-X9-DG protein
MLELLVVTGVLSILAAILFPVFRQAIQAAKRSQCTTHYRQISGALAMYMSDYDDKVPPVNYRNVQLVSASDDRTWVQTLLPYVSSMTIFMCPADTGRASGFSGKPQSGAGGDPYADYYLASLRSNLGYNYMYFSPLLRFSDGRWESFPIRGSRVSNPAATLVFIDSVWDRTASGSPTGGGSWVVVPPCRYARQGNQIVDTFEFQPGTVGYFGFRNGGWDPASRFSWLVYGGAWPWHHGRFNMMFLDGHVKTVSVAEMTAGCDARPAWQGLITSLEEYPWDLNQ